VMLPLFAVHDDGLRTLANVVDRIAGALA